MSHHDASRVWARPFVTRPALKTSLVNNLHRFACKIPLRTIWHSCTWRSMFRKKMIGFEINIRQYMWKFSGNNQRKKLSYSVIHRLWRDGAGQRSEYWVVCWIARVVSFYGLIWFVINSTMSLLLVCILLCLQFYFCKWCVCTLFHHITWIYICLWYYLWEYTFNS